MAKLIFSATSLVLLQLFANLMASSVYKSYTSDITKVFPSTAAGTTTAVILPNKLKPYATAAASVHTHSHAPHKPCKLHHSTHYPRFFIPAPATTAHYYRHLYPVAAPVSVPVPVDETPTIYFLSAPPGASSHSDYAAPPLPGYAAATRPSLNAASAAYYDNLHATSAAAAVAVRPPFPHAAYAPSPYHAFDFADNFAWQQALQGNFAK